MLHSSILLEKLTDLERRLQILPLGSQEEALIWLWWPGFCLSIRIASVWNEMGGGRCTQIFRFMESPGAGGFIYITQPRCTP